MRPSSAAGLVATLLASLVALSCSGARRASSAQPSSAQLRAAGSPELRTVDNAGYVDPGGRTRQVTQGAGPAPLTREDGVPPPRRERPSGPVTQPPAPAPSSSSPIPAPAGILDFEERAARALCDREVHCGRLGPGGVFESADACMTAKRERVRAVIHETPCDEIRGDRAAGCLAAIRGAACGAAGAVLEPPAECTSRALCPQ